MAPKQKGGGSAPKKQSVADEVEETLQAVVRLFFSGLAWSLSEEGRRGILNVG